MTSHNAYERIGVMAILGTSAKIDRAADSAGVDRGTWLRTAIAHALANPTTLQSLFETKET